MGQKTNERSRLEAMMVKGQAYRSARKVRK